MIKVSKAKGYLTSPMPPPPNKSFGMYRCIFVWTGPSFIGLSWSSRGLFSSLAVMNIKFLFVWLEASFAGVPSVSRSSALPPGTAHCLCSRFRECSQQFCCWVRALRPSCSVRAGEGTPLPDRLGGARATAWGAPPLLVSNLEQILCCLFGTAGVQETGPFQKGQGCIPESQQKE